MGKVVQKKKCKLCGSNFETTREWQKFCRKEHQVEYWRVSFREKGSLVKRIENLEDELAKKKTL